jgi:PKD repeat protein
MKTLRLFTLILSVIAFGSASAQCDATFTSTNQSNGTFVFTNPGTYGGYYWDFGNGNTASGQTVTYQYNANGAYSVCLTVYDSITSCTDTYCDSVLVSGLSGGSSSNCDASFDAIADSISCNTIYYGAHNSNYSNYYWDFGDGTSGNNVWGTHTYAQDGTYAVGLVVIDTDSSGNVLCGDTLYQTVVINCNGGGSSATCDASFDAIADSVSCNAIYYGAHNSNYSNYYWDFGDGTTSNSVWGVHTYAQDGTYTVGLAVVDTDSSGNYVCGDTMYQTIVINCNGGSGTTCNADFILLQDSINSGVYYAWNMSTGNNLTYYWDFGDGNSSTQAYPVHTYASVGSYNLCLTIDDGNGCTSTYCDTINVVVKANGTVLNVLEPGQTVSVEEVNVLEEVNLYPNPTNGQFSLSIDLTQSSEFTISVMNYVGQIVERNNVQLTAGQNVLDMNVSNQPKGVYIVNIMDDNSGVSRNIKLIKE